MFRHIVFTAFTSLALVALAGADAVQNLVSDLQQPDTPAQVRARQLLPREGATPVPLLLPLLSNAEPRISWSAKRVLEDICNEAAKPGAPTGERSQIATALMAELGVGKPEFVTVTVLELLAIVAPEGFDMRPLGTLLNDIAIRERVRDTLFLAGTTEARGVLREALRSDDASLVYSVLDSLEKLRDYDSLPGIRALYTHSDPAVRSSAIRATAWTGDAALIGDYKAVIAQAIDKTSFEAYDALLKLTAAIVIKGGRHQVAMNVYHDLLANAPNPVVKAGAMMGLGKYGDEREVPVLVQAATDNPELEDALTPSLESMRGHAGAVAIAAAYPGLSHTSKIRILEMCARRQDEPLIGVLLTELGNSEPTLHDTAQAGLIAAGRIEAMPALIEAAQKAEGDAKAVSIETIIKLAQSMGRMGNAGGAGQVYKTAFELAATPDQKSQALQGITQFPVSGAYDLVKAASSDAGLKATSIPALLAISGVLAKEEQGDKAVEALQLATQLEPTPELLQQITAQLQTMQNNAAAQAAMGFIREWKVIGPFDWAEQADWDKAFIGEPSVDLAKEIKSADVVLAWKSVNADNSMALVDLIGTIGQRDRSFAYAYAEVPSAKAQAAQLRIGSDDGVRAWVNGKMVHDNNVDRGAALDQDVVNVELKEGVNTILLRISQGAGGWNFMARLSGPGGAPIDLGS
ncbi:MAG: hypothetical protein AMXMBFR84_17290 [Candidatus Hydrogenedentota bacterium]